MSKTTSAPKKAAAKKVDVKTDSKPEIFKQVRSIMQTFAPPLTITKDTGKVFELVSDKSIEFMGKKRDNVYFGTVMIMGSYVGFYLMPIYAQPALIEQLGPDLRKLLKGKSCFHIKKTNPDLLKQIQDSMKVGLECYLKLKFI